MNLDRVPSGRDVPNDVNVIIEIPMNGDPIKYELDKIAARHAHHLPWSVHFLLRGLGAKKRSGSNLVSYLLFERPYCRALITLGYRDAMQRRSQILEFLNVKEDDAIARVDRREAVIG